MRAEGSRQHGQGGLAQAQRELSGLMSELEQTLDLVNRLSDAGEDRAALRLLEEQRTELYRVMDAISHDVGRRRTFAEAMRRNLAAVAAAAVLIVTSLAASVIALRPDAVEAATAALDRAETIVDVRERLVVLVEVYERTRTLPAEQAVQVEDDLRAALAETLDDAGPGEDDPIVDQAEDAFHDLEQGKPPNPPTAPGNGQGPVETIQELLPDP